MSEQAAPRYGIDPYLDWVEKEGIPVTEDYGIDLFKVDMKMAALWCEGCGCPSQGPR